MTHVAAHENKDASCNAQQINAAQNNPQPHLQAQHEQSNTLFVNCNYIHMQSIQTQSQQTEAHAFHAGISDDTKAYWNVSCRYFRSDRITPAKKTDKKPQIAGTNRSAKHETGHNK